MTLTMENTARNATRKCHIDFASTLMVGADFLSSPCVLGAPANSPSDASRLSISTPPRHGAVEGGVTYPWRDS
jgi:hypothetical protein